MRRALLNGKISTIVLAAFLLISLGCSNEKKKSLDGQLSKRLELLIKKKDFDKANVLVDSLIQQNKNSGDLYCTKAMIETQLEDFNSSIINLKKAIALNYNKKACEELIEFNKSLAAIKSKYELKADGVKNLRQKKDSTLH